jgi:hypothetical protein
VSPRRWTDPPPEWWLVTKRHVPAEGTELRIAFRDLPTHTVWVPLLNPTDDEVEHLARLILDPPLPTESPGKGRDRGVLKRPRPGSP